MSLTKYIEMGGRDGLLKQVGSHHKVIELINLTVRN
jgi:hypothetical protein